MTNQITRTFHPANHTPPPIIEHDPTTQAFLLTDNGRVWLIMPNTTPVDLTENPDLTDTQRNQIDRFDRASCAIGDLVR